MKKLGFTLAEVLITLGIIGVVCAITMPNLISSYREQIVINQLNQTYSLLQQATQKMIQDNGDLTINYFGADAEERMNKYAGLLPKYLNIVKVCPISDRGCVPFEFAGIGYPWVHRNLYLNNGVMLMIKNDGGQCTQDMTLQKCFCANDDCSHKKCHGSYFERCGTVWVDINGKKGPNASGKDVFEFIIVQDGILPAGLPSETLSIMRFEKVCLDNEYKGRCTAWIIHNKNMDYLRCPEKLGWNKASSCKD